MGLQGRVRPNSHNRWQDAGCMQDVRSIDQDGYQNSSGKMGRDGLCGNFEIPCLLALTLPSRIGKRVPPFGEVYEIAGGR